MISLLCLHRFLLDKGLVDFIVVMHNRYTVQCKLHRFIFNFLLVRTTSHQIVSRYCCALKPSLRIFATVDYRKNKFVSWLENFVIRLSFVRSFFFFIWQCAITLWVARVTFHHFHAATGSRCLFHLSMSSYFIRVLLTKNQNAVSVTSRIRGWSKKSAYGKYSNS